MSDYKQTRDAAGNVTSQYGQMLRNLDDDLVKPCPFCGGTNIKSGGEDKVVGYWCLDCQAVGPNQYGRYEWNDRADRIEELEAKLAKAVAVAEKSIGWLRLYGADVHKESTTLAELKGKDDE